MKNKLFVVGQVVLIAVALIGVFIFYPRAEVDLEGNRVNINSINANLIIISENPDFSNPRYVDVEDKTSFSLKSGKYYWKASNGIIEGLSKELVIDSNVGLQIIDKDEDYVLKNVGDVKVNVTRSKGGGFVGHIILEPEETEVVGEGEYIGREADDGI